MKKTANVRRGLLIGLGAMSLTVKKVNQTINDLAKKNGITSAEAKKLSAKLLAEGKKQQAALKKVVDRELDNLEKQLKKQEKKQKPKAKKATKKKAAKKKATKKKPLKRKKR